LKTNTKGGQTDIQGVSDTLGYPTNGQCCLDLWFLLFQDEWWEIDSEPHFRIHSRQPGRNALELHQKEKVVFSRPDKALHVLDIEWAKEYSF